MAFAAGSPQCQELRREHGVAPLVPQPVADDIVAEILQACFVDNLKVPALLETGGGSIVFFVKPTILCFVPYLFLGESV